MRPRPSVALLLAPVVAMLVSVLGVWLLAVVVETWALVVAVAVAVCAMLAMAEMIGWFLADEDEDDVPAQVSSTQPPSPLPARDASLPEWYLAEMRHQARRRRPTSTARAGRSRETTAR
jgi:hypothetical protein